MKKVSNILWGLVLIAAGIVFTLNAMEITNIDIFFDGWWTLFIIVPCLIGLLHEKDKTGNLIGIGIGVLLLLSAQEILDFSVILKLIFPLIIIAVGLQMLFSGLFRNKTGKIMEKIKDKGGNPRVACATFTGCRLDCSGEVFDGAELNAIFGGVKCDLRGAVIEEDCAIQVTAIFGGVDICVPQNVNVKVNPTCIFGGISNKTKAIDGAPTLYISGICMFGGVDIK
jgi:predicted membrane protein